MAVTAMQVLHIMQVAAAVVPVQLVEMELAVVEQQVVVVMV